MIQLKNVSKTYGKKDQKFVALDSIDLEIPQGLSVAIVGKSGSGKSTLMHVMSGLDKASSGQVIVDGQDIAKLKQKEVDRFRAQKIGFIFQSFFVQANESCYHNVCVPLEISRIKGTDRKTRVTKALEHVDLIEKVSQKAKNLSGGQKQRLAIARAIVNDPKILFADEPTGNLDSHTGERIIELLFDLNKNRGVTLVIVTHDDELAQKCDMQVHVRDGKIVEVTKNGEQKHENN